MSNKQKLELTWIGKGEEPALEPRILIEDPGKSYGDPTSQNMLIHGDNLLALKALEQDYAEKIGCIYIDPPYNTGSAFEHYDDGVEHSQWLSLMHSRLQLLYKLLDPNGLLAIQIDDNEYAKLYLLLSEIFGQNNLKTIIVKMSEPSGLKMGSVKRFGTIPKLKEYIILAKKTGINNLHLERVKKEKWDTEYNIFLENFTQDDKALLDSINSSDEVTDEDVLALDTMADKIALVSVADKIKKLGIDNAQKENWLFSNAWRICQCATSSSILRLVEIKKESNQSTVFSVRSKKHDQAYLVRAKYSEESQKPRVQLIFAEDNLMVHPGDLWLDIKTTGLEAEGGVSFKNGKKPESLVARIIGMSTTENDFVLDSFLGSGTTMAVAHKMKRRWIGIELGQQAYSHCVPRIKSVVDGQDLVGVTKTYGWTGGGGFKFYELAPSLLAQDIFGNWIISKDYDANMLAHAMAKQEAFTYSPSQTTYWKQGYSTESDYIYTTTQYMSIELLDAIHDEMQEGESLLIACKAFDAACKDRHDNITIKKIPLIILGRCEFGKDDYSLNVLESVGEGSKEEDES